MPNRPQKILGAVFCFYQKIFCGLFLSILNHIVYLDKNRPKLQHIMTKSFGELLRSLREEAGLTLKTVAVQINVDTSLLAKIERCERQPTKSIIKQVADFFKVDEQELYNVFLSDQIAYKILDGEADLSVLKVAEEKVKYLKTVQNGK